MGLEWLIGVKELVFGIRGAGAVVEVVEGLLGLNVNQVGSSSFGVGGMIASLDIEISGRTSKAVWVALVQGFA
jgi:hypothetical protein